MQLSSLRGTILVRDERTAAYRQHNEGGHLGAEKMISYRALSKREKETFHRNSMPKAGNVAGGKQYVVI